MKTKILLFILIISFFSINNSNAATVADNILLTWNVAEDTTWAWYGWKLVFPNNTTNWVKIITSSYSMNQANFNEWTWDMWITWNFWLSNLSSSTDSNLGWCSFDIWNVAWASKVKLKNNWNNTFTFSGYAWCNAAWWIYFSQTNLVPWDNNTKVVYNRWTWKINGCAFSENLWWICIDNISLDTTPPDVNDASWVNFSKPFAANHTKSLTTPENIQKIEVQNRNSTATTNYITNTFTHDFRKAKSYQFIVTDSSWNISNPSNISVVAWTPSVTLNPNNIWVTEASTFTSTLNDEKIADNTETHNINFKLRDTYWNVIKNETGIKNVTVEIWFDNNVDTDQINNLDLWNAISYSNNPFSLVNWLVLNSGSWYNVSWNYNIDIKSKAPTKAWYTFTSNNNDIKVSNLKVIVTALNWNTWVWENTPAWANFTQKYNTNFKFTPVIKVDSLTNNTNNIFIRDIETEFSWNIVLNKSPWSDNITNLDIQHKLDIMSWSTFMNHRISFQDIEKTNNTQKCIWYVKPNSNNTDYTYEYTNSDCNLSIGNKSNIIKYYSWPIGDNFLDWFKATPKIVLAALSKFDVKYSSNINYNLWNDNIKYPSLEQIYSNSAINNEINITWITHKNENSFAVVEDSSINYIWKLDKTEIYTQIKKNISQYEKVWVWTYWSVKYFNTTQSINNSSFSTWIDTIIVNGWNVIITNDILKVSWKPKIIIALKKSDGTWWNIWIKNTVQFVAATLITDRSLLSWDWSNYYSDNSSAKNQLFIKWSILSYNTIGWASSATPKCPFYINTTCDLQTAKRYDLNHFRWFVNWVNTSINWSSYWIDMTKNWYANAPMIVEYDSEIQTKTPSILLIK